MKKNILLLLFTATLSTIGFGQVSYTTSCEIKNGTAYGYVHNHKDAFDIDGNVWFHFYDTTGTFISSEDEYESEYVSSKSSEEIEHTGAPAKACKCTFDVSAATKAQNTFGQHDIPKVISPNPSVTTPPVVTTSATVFPSDPKAAAYSTSCVIKNGTAYGSVNNLRESFEIDGNVSFYFYDASGRYLSGKDEYEYEYVSSRSTEEVEQTSAPNGACTCSFEVKDAIKTPKPVVTAPAPTPFPTPTPAPAQPKPANEPTYTTSCEIRNGTAYGYVNNLRDAFDIDGYVWFYFYDKTGKFLGSEDEYESEWVSSRSTEEIEHTSAPFDACSCKFEVDGAIKK